VPQPRNIGLSVAVLRAWQAEAMRRTVTMNRDGDRRAAKHFLEREVRWLERYGRELPGADALLAGLVLLLRRADEDLDQRLRKEIYAAASMRSFAKEDHRAARLPLRAAAPGCALVGRRYFAYGSNMCAEQMARRCPAAEADGLVTLDGWPFVVNRRGVATLVPAPQARAGGLLWRLTPACEAARDRSEGVAEGHYREEVWQFAEAPALVYLARETRPGMPRPGYLQRILAAPAAPGVRSRCARSSPPGAVPSRPSRLLRAARHLPSGTVPSHPGSRPSTSSRLRGQ
jgi:hypothetical protein